MRGRVIAQVTTISPQAFSLEQRNKGLTERFLQLQQHLKFFRDTTSGGKATDPNLTFTPNERRRVMRVLLADGTFAFFPLESTADSFSVKPQTSTCDEIDRYLSVYDNEPSVLKCNLNDLQRARAELREKMMICVQKRVFCCEDQTTRATLRFGLAPIDVEVGDHIAVLHGSRVPIVLRPVPSAEQKADYEMVGQCYVEGAMCGESVVWKEDEAATLLLR